MGAREILGSALFVTLPAVAVASAVDQAWGRPAWAVLLCVACLSLGWMAWQRLRASRFSRGRMSMRTFLIVCAAAVVVDFAIEGPVRGVSLPTVAFLGGLFTAVGADMLRKVWR